MAANPSSIPTCRWCPPPPPSTPRLGHVSPARAFNGIAGIVVVLGPLTLFFMAWRMTGAPGYSFWAALAYSLTSPARALIHDPNFNLAYLWSSRRFYTMIVWDDIPHGAAVCFLPLAILFLCRSILKRRRNDYLRTIACIALAAFASVFGVTAMIMIVACVLFALEPEPLPRNLLLVAILGGLAYLIVCPFLPPSLIAAIRDNQQVLAEDQWSLGSLTALSLGHPRMDRRLATACGALSTTGRCASSSSSPICSASSPSSTPTPIATFCRRPAAISRKWRSRIPLAVVFSLRPLLDKFPRSVKVALATGHPVARRRTDRRSSPLCQDPHVSRSTSPSESNIAWPAGWTRISPATASWFPAPSPSGSMSSATPPQLSGGSYSTTPNLSQQEALRVILTSKGPTGAAASLLWLKAFGVQAVVVTGPKSHEFWGAYADPHKFDELLPVLSSENDVTIYRVPGRSASLAHLIPPAAVARNNSTADLEKYVAALDDPSLPIAEMRWTNAHRAEIRTVATVDQTVSVQTAWHPGWHARANGRPAEIRRDGLGFLNVLPRCSGSCEIALDYDGGWEYKLCRLLSALTVLGLVWWGSRSRLRPAFRRLFRVNQSPRASI